MHVRGGMVAVGKRSAVLPIVGRSDIRPACGSHPGRQRLFIGRTARHVRGLWPAHAAGRARFKGGSSAPTVTVFTCSLLVLATLLFYDARRPSRLFWSDA